MKFIPFAFLWVLMSLGTTCFASALPPSSPFGIITVPQSGTHLLMKCVGMLQNRTNLCIRRAIDLRDFNRFNYEEGKDLYLKKIERLIDSTHYFDEHSHLSSLIGHFMDAHPDFPWIIGVRDLRDTVVSQAHYIWNKLETRLGPTTLQQKISYLLDYTHYESNCAHNTPTLYYQANSILGICNKPQALVVHFEDLVGSKGGGSDDLQRATIIKIAAHIGVPLDEKRLNYIQENLFGTDVRVKSMKEETFRSGKIGSWKESFNAENKKIFQLHYTKLNKALGY